MLVKSALSIIALLVGGWMIFDGVYIHVYGKYFGPEEPGPWAGLVRASGLDPFSFGKVFIVIGALWLFFLAGVLLDQSWAWYGAVIVAVCSLWYLPVGTILSIIYLALLLIFRARLGH